MIICRAFLGQSAGGKIIDNKVLDDSICWCYRVFRTIAGDDRQQSFGRFYLLVILCRAFLGQSAGGKLQQSFGQFAGDTLQGLLTLRGPSSIDNQDLEFFDDDTLSYRAFWTTAGYNRQRNFGRFAGDTFQGLFWTICWRQFTAKLWTICWRCLAGPSYFAGPVGQFAGDH